MLILECELILCDNNGITDFIVRTLKTACDPTGKYQPNLINKKTSDNCRLRVKQHTTMQVIDIPV